MRCHFSDDDDHDMNPPAYNIWTSGTLQTPNILKSILNLNVSEEKFTDTFEGTSPSQKRKLLDCEKEDFEERYHKVQRKKHLQKIAARAHLVLDEEKEESDEEEKLYRQMDWVERESMRSLKLCDSSNVTQFDNDKKHTSMLFLPTSKLKEERRRLLRISMAKIQCVEDPEVYLRRSVLINNTVKRLQNDIPLNYRYMSLASLSFIEEKGSRAQSSQNWGVICKSESGTLAAEYEYGCLRDNGLAFNIQRDEAADSSFNFQGSGFSDQTKTRNDVLFSSKASEDQQKLIYEPLAPLLKPASSSFSPQSCGLQYRYPVLQENSIEYRESSSPSLIDSVVYSSLMASLET